MSFGFGLGFGFGAGQGGAFVLSSLWANGEEATLYEADDLTSLYINIIGAAAIASDGETVGMSLDMAAWDGGTLEAYLNSQAEAIAEYDMGDVSGWTYDSGWVDTTPGELSIVDADGPQNIYPPLVPDVVGNGEWAKFELEYKDVPGVGVYAYLLSGSPLIVPTGTGTYSLIRQRGAATLLIRANDGKSGTLVGLRIRPLPGNHATQSTTSAEPVWKTGGFLRHDGFDDGQLTNVYCGSGGSTLAQKMTLPAAGASTKCTTGLSGSSTARFYLGHLSNGKLAAGVGNHTTSTIFGGDDISGETGVAVLTEDGSTVNLYWDNTLVYTGAQSGAPSTSVPFARGFLNNNGTPAIHCAIDEYKWLHLDRAATPAEVANITAKWS